MHNSAFEKMNNTGTKTELRAKPEWDLVISDFETPKLPGGTEVGKYKSSEILPTNNKEFSQRFTPESKIDEKTTKMATIEILDKNGKVVEDFSFSRMPSSEKQIQDMADSLIRERVLKKAFNSKEFDTSMKGLKNLDVNKVETPKTPMKSDIDLSPIVTEAKKYKSIESFKKALKTKVWSKEVLKNLKPVFE